MKEKLRQTIGFIAIILVLPAIGAREQAMTWPVGITAFILTIFNLTQPRFRLADLPKENVSDRRSIYYLFLVGFTGFLLPYLDYLYGRKRIVALDQCWSMVAIGLIFGGLAFRIWSIRMLGKFFTARVEVQSDQTVIDVGPYHFLRHPSYSGAFAMYVGVSILFRSYVGLAFMFFVFFPVYTYRIRAEESALANELGEPYQNYMNRTWRMLPFVY